MNNTARKLKDCFLDMSGHYWLHLVAVVVIGVLYAENRQIEQLREQQKEREISWNLAEEQLVWQVRDLTGFIIQDYLNKGLVSAGLLASETSSRHRSRGNEHEYEHYYALTDEEFAALPTEEQMSSLLGGLLFSGPLKAEQFSISVSRKAPEKWNQYCEEPAPLPPGHAWYCVNVKYSFPSTYQYVNHTEIPGKS